MLPHGGSPIKNPLSTRHSIVFHVVPNQMRVYGNDLFFLKNKFNSFLEPPTSIQIKNSLYIQEQSCGFMDEGVDNKDMNFLSSKIKKLRNKITKIKDKFFCSLNNFKKIIAKVFKHLVLTRYEVLINKSFKYFEDYFHN